MGWQETYNRKITTAERAVSGIKSGNRIFLTGNCSVPQKLLAALVKHSPNIYDVEICQALTIGEKVAYTTPEMERHLRVSTAFVSQQTRAAVNEGRADFTPVLLSEFTLLFKNRHPGKIVAGFIIGTKRLYDYVDDNPIIELHPTEYVNDPFVIAQNYRQVAINSAIEVDLTGQICADSIGTYLYSGVGGQFDFIYGASRSEGGVPIVALPATARRGEVSRIVPTLKTGAGVVTTRNHVHGKKPGYPTACCGDEWPTAQ